MALNDVFSQLSLSWKWNETWAGLLVNGETEKGQGQGMSDGHGSDVMCDE